MPVPALALLATLLSYHTDGNIVRLTLSRGSAEVVWVSSSTFHFRRTSSGPLPPAFAVEHGTVPLEIEDSPRELHLRSHDLDLSIEKDGLRLHVKRATGEPLVDDVDEATLRDDGKFEWTRQAPPGERIYGLGAGAGDGFDLRGQSASTPHPFLLSSAGYGEYYAGEGAYHFELGATGQYRIVAPRLDYYVFYGPQPREIFDERNTAVPDEGVWTVPQTAPPDWAGLRASLQAIVRGYLSGLRGPKFDLSLYDSAPAGLAVRARQMASLIPGVTGGAAGVSEFRKRLDTFYAAYGPELTERGYPMWHPLPYQFPSDPECALHADEFLLGDEMLIAPITDPSGSRQVYLPQGIWTDIATNRTYTGKQTITVSTPELPVFSRNGTILPLDRPGGLDLHYFPKLGAEFFVVEPGLEDYTQIHAAPMLDLMRLEIESKKARTYHWTVHHIDKPADVSFDKFRYRRVTSESALQPGTWFYDARQKNLHVLLQAAAGEDSIVNIVFPASRP